MTDDELEGAWIVTLTLVANYYRMRVWDLSQMPVRVVMYLAELMLRRENLWD